ncbi:hypothetical protein GCM10022222_84840 [Amycolatopsis ultiminotia]|uniref:Integrase n=1 Tax=Amycolatopsis ultiminotia TaxID=543629 RepID=A0ABP6YQH5_9PSEU
MPCTAEDYRAQAAACRCQARNASPPRATQLRECAKTFLREARRLDLFEHSKQVGPANVTAASFRTYLRNRHT